MLKPEHLERDAALQLELGPEAVEELAETVRPRLPRPTGGPIGSRSGG